MTSDDILEELAFAKDPSRQLEALAALLLSAGPGGRLQPHFFAAVCEHCVKLGPEKVPGMKRMGYAFLRSCGEGVGDGDWGAMLECVAVDMRSRDAAVAAEALTTLTMVGIPRRILALRLAALADTVVSLSTSGPEPVRQAAVTAASALLLDSWAGVPPDAADGVVEALGRLLLGVITAVFNGSDAVSHEAFAALVRSQTHPLFLSANRTRHPDNHAFLPLSLQMG